MRIPAALVLVILASPALADPLPAGKCVAMDDGVAQVTPLSPARTEGVPKVVSMALPRMGTAVADIAFRINSDGSVAELNVLCISVPGANLKAVLLQASKSWKFTPLKRSGREVAAIAAYRLSDSGVTPLNFIPDTRPRKLTG
jgi:acetyl-CoA acetyltransferase